LNHGALDVVHRLHRDRSADIIVRRRRTSVPTFHAANDDDYYDNYDYDKQSPSRGANLPDFEAVLVDVNQSARSGLGRNGRSGGLGRRGSGGNTPV